MASKVLVTTSRRPSNRVRSFVKDLASVIPGALKITRGHYSMEELVREAMLHGADRIVVVGGRKGNPGIIRVYGFIPQNLEAVNIVTFIVKGVTLSREARLKPPPHRDVKELVVEPQGCELAYEFSEAFIIAFHGKVSAKTKNFIVALLKCREDNIIETSFRYLGDRPVGPRIRLARPAALIKRDNLEKLLY